MLGRDALRINEIAHAKHFLQCWSQGEHLNFSVPDFPPFFLLFSTPSKIISSLCDVKNLTLSYDELLA